MPTERSRILIPALAKRGYEMAMTALPIQSALLCSKADCDMAAVRVLYSLLAGCSVCHFAHARLTMPSISLVIIRMSHAHARPLFVSLPVASMLWTVFYKLKQLAVCSSLARSAERSSKTNVELQLTCCENGAPTAIAQN